MSKKTLLRSTAILAAGLLLSSAATAQNNHIVEVAPVGFTFEPQDINVNVGDTVTWVWAGGGTHDVVSDAGAFQSALVSAPNTFSVTFDGAFVASNPVGSDLYTYHCTPHRPFGMVGSVQVMDARVLSVTNFGAGLSGSIDVSGANPGGTVILGYSLAGNGPFSIAMGTLSLSPPFNQLPPLTADAAGNASMPVTIPAGLAGSTVHLHGAEMFGGGAGILTTPLSATL
ncbi:MAG: cupredoxin domain-containing protein [Planctomycetota bacterium]